MGWDRNHGDGRINQPQTIIWAMNLKRRGLRPNNPGMGRKVNRRSLKEGKEQISEESREAEDLLAQETAHVKFLRQKGVGLQPVSQACCHRTRESRFRGHIGCSQGV